MAEDDPVRKLLKAFESRAFLADIHLLLSLDQAEPLNQRNPDAPVLLVPECLEEVFARASPEHDEMLSELITWSRPDLREAGDGARKKILADIRERYAQWREWGQIEGIPDEVDPEIAGLVEASLATGWSGSNLSSKVKYALTRYTTTLISVSKRTGAAILARGTEMVQSLRDRFAALELPAKADALIEKKEKLGKRLWPFKGKGAKAKKWFVVAVVTAAGIKLTPFGWIGLVLVFADP